ncbi:hypothetical protein BC941DRAFT_402284 [Chlamydoabsidia padenii]|nr:hypothetical protein BC941DRAFT_402284 [Chlamydoabsidia padenii]
MTTSKISLPPIKQMLDDVSVIKESPMHRYPVYQPTRQQINSPVTYTNHSDAYTFDSWHEYLPTANCQCATNMMNRVITIPTPPPVNKYEHQTPMYQSPKYHTQHHIYPPLDMNPSHHPHRPSHRRAHSASTSYMQAPYMATHPLHQPEAPKRIWSTTIAATHPGVRHRGRARAHTTSGYLPVNNMASPPPSFSLSPSTTSSSSMDTSVIKPTPRHYEERQSSSPVQNHQQQQRHRYHCQHCPKTFSRPSSLRIHIYSHTGEKPHICPYFECGRRFSVQSNMRRHIRVHVENNNNNNNNNNILSRGEHQSHLNGDHFSDLDASSAGGLIYQQPSHDSTPNFMLHGH